MNEIVVRTPAAAGQKVSAAVKQMIDANPLNPVGVSCVEGFMTKLDMMIRGGKYSGLNWNNIDMDRFALDCFAMAKLELTPMVNNLVHIVPFRDKDTGRYSATLIIGYKGLGLVAKKFGLNCPKSIRAELVYSSDHFELTEADLNAGFGFVHRVCNPFDRGEVVGGYAVFEHETGSIVRIMSLKDMMKRKPLYAPPEFWGGEKDAWSKGKTTGAKVKVEGWLVEMLTKTLLRWAWGQVTLDPAKVAGEGGDVARILAEEPDARESFRLDEDASDRQQALLKAIEDSKAGRQQQPPPAQEATETKQEEGKPEDDPLARWQAILNTKKDSVHHLRNWWLKNKEQARSELGGKFEYFDIEVDATINDMTPEEPPLPEPPPHLR